MSLAKIEERFRTEQKLIDDLERQLTDLFDGHIGLVIAEGQRFAGDVARAKQIIRTFEARAS